MCRAPLLASSLPAAMLQARAALAGGSFGLLASKLPACPPAAAAHHELEQHFSGGARCSSLPLHQVCDPPGRAPRALASLPAAAGGS